MWGWSSLHLGTALQNRFNDYRLEGLSDCVRRRNGSSQAKLDLLSSMPLTSLRSVIYILQVMAISASLRTKASLAECSVLGALQCRFIAHILFLIEITEEHNLTCAFLQFLQLPNHESEEGTIRIHTDFSNAVCCGKSSEMSQKPQGMTGSYQCHRLLYPFCQVAQQVEGNNLHDNA